MLNDISNPCDVHFYFLSKYGTFQTKKNSIGDTTQI